MIFSSAASAQDRFSLAAKSLVSRGGQERSVLLDDGRLLIVGGEDSSGGVLRSAELFNKGLGIFATTGEFTSTGSMSRGRQRPIVAKLTDGRVLVAGGVWDLHQHHYSDIEIYDPVAGTFSAGGSMQLPRHGANGVALQDGRVLLVGGYPLYFYNLSVYNPRNTADLYDPSTKTSSLVGMHQPRARMNSVRLSDGRVLVSGGLVSQYVVTASMEIFDPTTNAFSSAGNMSVSRRSHASILLRDGRVLICGGLTGYADSSATKICDIYDPLVGAVTKTITMNGAHASPALAQLQDGRVLIVGAESPRVEVFDPATDSFSALTVVPSIAQQRGGFALPDGRVLFAAGGVQQCEFFIPNGWGTVTNQPPVADAGPDQIVLAGSNGEAVVVLDGSGSSDPDNDPLVFNWTGAFGAATGVSPSIRLPAGFNTVTLTVRDDHDNAVASTVRIAVAAGTDSGTVAALEQRIQDLTTALAVAEAALAECAAEEAALAAQNASLSEQLAQANAKIAQLTTEAQTASASIDGLESQVASLEAQLAAALAQADALARDLAAAVEASRQLGGQNTSLLEQLAASDQRVEALTAQNSELQLANRQLAEANAALVAQLGTLTQMLASAFSDPAFEIPGATPQEQLQNLVSAINQLNSGQKQALYKKLGGTK